MAQQDKWEKQHLKSIAKYEKLIQQIYSKYVQEAARIGADITNFDASDPLAFDDYPLTRKRIAKMQQQMAADIEAVVTNGIDEQWALSDVKTEALIASAFKGASAEELELLKAKYLINRDDAREAFKMRKESGMNLSDRVWQYTDQFKEEMEMGIDLGLREGKSADALSRDLRKYLNNPNMLFRRVRDEHGVLHLSQRAKAYHPGRGVYRSSYKNARRLAATETNIAYRTADHDRIQNLDFVVGIRVNLSNNHTLNGKPFTDICDDLSAPFGSQATKGKGCYPKDFKFTGWHPLCRCFITTILKTPEEMDADEPTDPSQSENYVADAPDAFKAWSKENAERVERAKSVPYFIRDNRAYYDAVLAPKALSPLEVAKQRHAQRTPEQVEAIKDRWDRRQIFYGNYSAEQLAHFKKLEASLGIKRGMPMSVGKADEQSANPNFGKGFQYSINCQTCAPAYVLRRAGFDVYAKGKTHGSLSDWISRGHSFDIWTNADGSRPLQTRYDQWLTDRGYKQMTPQRYKQFFEESCRETGTYVVTIKWKGGQGAHATIIERLDDGSLWHIEPQAYNSKTGALRDIMDLCNNGAASGFGSRGVMRVDDKLFREGYLSIFEKY